VQLLHLLASGGHTAKNLWDPTILGVLTVLAGVVLFCGSTYLLLATNMGARQGFLVAFTGLTGIVMLIGMLWMTTATPLNVPKGRTAEWQPISDDPAEAIVTDLASSSVPAIRTIADAGTAVPVKAPEDGGEDLLLRGSLRPAVEAALVQAKPEGPEPVEPGPLVQFCDSCSGDALTDLDELSSYVVGGDTKNVFWHEHRYAAVQFCEKLPVTDDPNVTPGTPECDPAKVPQYLLLEYDYGSVRLPTVFYTLFSGLLFALGLYALHVKERSDQAAAGALSPATA
jgi:hypothetical protein